MSKDSYGSSLLPYLAEMGHCEFARRLLKLYINSKDKNGRSPLIYAAMNNKRYFEQLLLEQSNIEASSEDKSHILFTLHLISKIRDRN
jgi:ankyrin repeat protein